MPIMKRFASKAKPEKRGSILRRTFGGMVKKYADNVEEYVFSLPKEPITYTDLICDWVLPYQENHFVLFGQKLRLTPRYKHVMNDDKTIIITGLHVEVLQGTKPKRKIVDGPRGTWHAKTKFFVKVSMDPG